MSSSPPRQRGALLVLGSGPGIGIAVAKLFAQRGFRRVILCARNAERLAKEVEEVKSVAEEDTEVSAITVDLGSAGSVKGALAELEGSLGGIGGADDEEGKGKGRLEAVLFNAARIGPSKLWEFGEEGLRNDFEVALSLLPLHFSEDFVADDSARSPSHLSTPSPPGLYPNSSRQPRTPPLAHPFWSRAEDWPRILTRMSSRWQW